MQQQPPAPGAPYGAPHGHPYPQPPQKSSGSNWVVILAVIGIAFIAILGILAAIAIPAFTKYMRRSKTAEARVNVARMADALSQYYSENGKCPDHDGPEGAAGVTPPLSVNCNSGASGKCRTGGGAGGYPPTAWSDNPVWSAIDFEPNGPHYFHYDFRWKEEDGLCQFTAQAFGDLDDDLVYSTYERSGAADVNGVSNAAGLFIENEVE